MKCFFKYRIGPSSSCTHSVAGTMVTFALVLICIAYTESIQAGDKNFSKVISLSPMITETIYLVGGENTLIANTIYCNVPEEAKYKEKIGSVMRMNVEKIIRLDPDLVIASSLTREKQIIMLEKMSIPVIRAKNPETFDQMCDLTFSIAQKLGCAEKAGRIIEKAKMEAAAILEKTSGLNKPSVFIQIGIKPLHSANKEMFINEYIRYGGGVNIAEHESSGIFSREKVLAVNPDVIMIATMGSSKKAGFVEREKWMAYKNMKAVKSNRIHVLDPEIICSPEPESFIKGLKDIIVLLHPGLFPHKRGSASSESKGDGM